MCLPAARSPWPNSEGPSLGVGVALVAGLVSGVLPVSAGAAAEHAASESASAAIIERDVMVRMVMSFVEAR